MESDIFVPDSQDEEPDPIRIQACKLRFLNARRCPTILSAKLKGPFRTSPFAATYRHLDSDDETLGTTFTYRRNDAFPAEAPIHINPPSTSPNNTVEPSTASPFRKAIVTKRTQKTANLCFITTPDIRDQRATKKTSTSEGESHAKRNGVSQRLLRSHHKDLDGHDPTAKAFRLEQYIESMNEPELPQTTDFNSTFSERTLSSDITALLSKSLRPTVVSTKERGHTTYTPQSDVENPDSPSLDCAGKEIAEIDTKEQQRYPIDQFSLSSPLLEERGLSPSTNKGSLASSSPPAIIVSETWQVTFIAVGTLDEGCLRSWPAIGRRPIRRSAKEKEIVGSIKGI
ncbi:hypothetical protein BC938DRAFT_472015 [Jimgerdemannia flammicorona]|uniref:Uncharacterized protein n=1 Tax=Jimgerdemannia flammicorona TaxID=994334 RepID=A0A433Q6Y2_9FUNG|nr:hypothetical protein BC938DRAFT_472015 [Jimgerdemannia flammicorona]